MPRIRTAGRGEGVQAVMLALRVLEHLAGQREPVGVTVLAQALGTTKSRIYRHLRTLMQAGYITQSVESERYRVGVRLVTLGRSVSENFDLANIARGAMRELRDALGHSVVVGLVEADGVCIVATLSGKSVIDIGVKQGSLLGFHYTAQGKVALAFGADDLQARVLRPRLDKQTPQTIVNAAALRRECKRIRHRGWAVAPNEALIGLNALAAPIFDGSGMLAGTLAVVDSVQFVHAEPSGEQIREVVDTARRISKALGYRALPASSLPVGAAMSEL